MKTFPEVALNVIMITAMMYIFPYKEPWLIAAMWLTGTLVGKLISRSEAHKK